MKKILCRADGNASVGLGHLYRIFALYEMYKETFDVVLVTREDSALQVFPEEYVVEVIPNKITLEEEPDWLANAFSSEEYSIIADGYQFVSEYQKKIKSLGFFLLYVDDLAREIMSADIVVNHALGYTPERYKTKNKTTFALGTKYGILRPKFLEAAKGSRKIFRINSVFVCFGGADQYDLSLLAVQALLGFDQIKNIHIVLGGAYQHEELFELKKAHSKITLHQNIDEQKMVDLMQSCEFAIAPSSTVLYELCCIKMPVLSGYFVENQKGIYTSFTEQDVVFSGGDFSGYTTEDFKTKISEILAVSDHSEMMQKQAKLFDGKIKQRFLNLLLPVTFREANLADTKLLFDWANDEVVRSNSYNSEEIDFMSHKEWFESKLDDKNQLFFIAVQNNNDIGLIRYTIEEDHAVLGISIAQEHRGKDLAGHMLRESARYYFKSHRLPIFAYIKKENTASIHSFKKAGYTFLRNEEVKGCKSFVYQLESI
ncbi:MAG: UDP-2,4-diacetamido-2,4,6-trideoxy-beta-L-altropyranose hydrolase [Flavobacteriaceae bacterium]|nr:UDP-2,4-diacetamido-2,4,6-trideoxy-beta-L-altropyranose hydrolase [Flavobacteriaceae bacterium]